MATKEKDTNKELEVEEIVSKSEQFIENNSKKIIYGIIAVALVVGAVLGNQAWLFSSSGEKSRRRHVQGRAILRQRFFRLGFKRQWS